MAAPARRLVRGVVQSLPWTAELYQRWRAHGEPPPAGYPLDRLAAALPGWVEAARRVTAHGTLERPRRVLVFAFLGWWVEHAAALSLLMAAVGHRVTLLTLPYRRWTVDPPRFDLRRQRMYIQDALRPAAVVLRLGDLTKSSKGRLPARLQAEVDHQSLLDVQYSLQREEIDFAGDLEAASLYRLRRRRNSHAASGALEWIARTSADVVLVPNGSILEFGAVYRAARAYGVPVSTYEFGEQRQRLWLAQNAQVMKLDTSELWRVRSLTPLTQPERDSLEGLYAARRSGAGWANFARQWQSGASEGAQSTGERLGLDPRRPVVLLCTNVVGDSLALDRQVFTKGMADWLTESVRHLADRPEIQVVVRVHPGELLGAGHPSQEIVHGSLPAVPESLHVVPPDSPINTYDLIELAHLGLVYTSTVGMEMAMAGVPVVVAGETHYRGKGFTYDPRSWKEYYEVVDRLLADPPERRLADEQIQLAQRYAARFFFEYPFPFPWHLIGFWDDIAARPMESVATPDGLQPYRRTLRALIGEPIHWAEARPR
jgi:hypothetical protein